MKMALCSIVIAAVALACPATAPGQAGVAGPIPPVELALPQGAGAWRVELTRSGGMRPGSQRLVVTSAGEALFTIERYAAGASRVLCSRPERLSREEAAELGKAVASARAAAWLADYTDQAHPQCCDQPSFGLTLELRGRKGVAESHESGWYVGSASMRPADLAAIDALLRPVWGRALDRCSE